MLTRSYVRRWWLLIVTVLAVMLALRGCVLRPHTSFNGAHFNRGRNAVWLGVEWVHEPHEARAVQDLAAALARQQVRYVFAYTSYWRADGSFNATYAHAASFVERFKRAQPDIQVLAWIGLPLHWPGNASGVDLADGATRQAISAFCARLVHEMGFDGVHLDPEPVADGDSHLLNLLSETRRSIGAQAMLSIATPHIWPLFPDVPWPLVGRVMWLGDYYRQVAVRVDQIALMTYDSTLSLDSLYRAWTRFQVIALSNALAETNAEVLIGIPTSEEQTATHLPGAENMTSGLQGLLDGLNDAASHPGIITGAAIYPYWETDEREWTVYHTQWMGE